MKYTPYPYQVHAKEHIKNNAAAGLFLDMGLGKTVTTLTAVDELMYSEFEVEKVLVIAPKRVAEHTWSTEAAKWDHLKHLRISKILGDAPTRKKAVHADADIYVINRENVPWLIGYLGSKMPFDMLVIDELSSFKSSNAERFRALKRVRPLIKRVVGLTGTPASNGLIDLWAQVYLLDQGARLGKTITGYREQYFFVAQKHGNVPVKYAAKSGADKRIFDALADICISMSAEDYLDVPECLDLVKHIELPSAVMGAYKEFKREKLLELSDKEITAVNAASLTGKLLQFCNGAVYDSDKRYHIVHDEKLDALAEIIEEANGKPVLVFYNFVHDLERVKSRFKSAVTLKGPSVIDSWNRGEIDLLLAHPASAGHGLNLQDGGNIIVWFGIPWSLELYEQAVGRLHRQGQSQKVMNNILICKGTWEDRVWSALQAKADVQLELLNALKYELDRI